ncbi:MAG TPA: hypothetical protein VD994_19865 [Prosthecobacter sp.]|nr:hypothetical protein [Prosthecobacter sp.]
MESQGQHEEDAVFSRSGVSGPLGKCSEAVKVWLPPELDFLSRQLAASAGMTQSELMRDLLCYRLKGKTYGDLCADSIRSAVIGKGALTALPVRDSMSEGPGLRVVSEVKA